MTRSNIYIDQGTDFKIVLDIYSSNTEYIDITNYSFESKAKKVYSSRIGFVFDVIKTANSTINVGLSANVSSSIEPGKYQYDLIMTDSSLTKTKILEGLVFILETNTK